MTFMDALRQDVQSTQWWVSVIIAGVVIPYAAGHIKTFLDKKVLSIFRSFRSEFVEHDEILRRRIDALKKDDAKQVKLVISELRHRLLALFYFAIIVLLVLITFLFIKVHGDTKSLEIALIPIFVTPTFIMLLWDNWTKGIDDGKLLKEIDDWD